MPAADPFDAVQRDDLDALRALIQDDRSIAASRGADGVSLLMFAHYRGRRDAARVLLDAIPELDVFEATTVGDLDRLPSLLDAEPELARAWSPDGFTALHFAAFFGQDGASALLIERGADVNAVSRNGLTVMPLHSALAGRHGAVSRRLIEAGAEINATQQDAFTPLHDAAQNGDMEMTVQLLESGADPKARLTGGATPADVADQAGHPEIAALIRSLMAPVS